MAAEAAIRGHFLPLEAWFLGFYFTLRVWFKHGTPVALRIPLWFAAAAVGIAALGIALTRERPGGGSVVPLVTAAVAGCGYAAARGWHVRNAYERALFFDARQERGSKIVSFRQACVAKSFSVPR